MRATAAMLLLALVSLAGAGCVRLGFDDAPGARGDVAPDGPGGGDRGAAGHDAGAPTDGGGAVADNQQGPTDAAAGAVEGRRSDGPAVDAVALADGGVGQQDAAGGTGIWIAVAGGTFMMGSPSSEACRSANEDLHPVTLTRSFEISHAEITQGDFQTLMGYNPSLTTACGPNCPVEQVSWHEAAAYCNALSARKGLASCYSCTGSKSSSSCTPAPSYTGAQIYGCPGYRLPTEAEWEYAYRAGTSSAFYSGAQTATTCGLCQSDPLVDQIAWYCPNVGPPPGGPHPVALLQANAWGIHDMAGNVMEWCHDRYDASLGTAPVTDPVAPATLPGVDRAVRGGFWYSSSYSVRAAVRDGTHPGNQSNIRGARCVRSLQP